MAMVQEKKTELVQKFKRHDKDTGSPEVQVALLSERITAPGPDGLRRVIGPGRRLLAVAELKGGLLRLVRVMVTPADLTASAR